MHLENPSAALFPRPSRAHDLTGHAPLGRPTFMAETLSSAHVPATRVSAERAESQRPHENPRKTPRQGRSQALVDALLTAASRVLGTVGIERSTTKRIAQRAGGGMGR